jgi:hypothetical protein
MSNVRRPGMSTTALAGPRQVAADDTVVLADTSGSMGLPEGSRRRIDILTDVLRAALAQVPRARVIAFSSLPRELDASEPRCLVLPEPEGGTALDLALDYLPANRLQPGRVIILSDGAPDDAAAALAAARRLAPVTIDAFYCGPDDERAAIGFMRALSLAGGRPGVSGRRSFAEPKQLAQDLKRLLLAAPAS